MSNLSMISGVVSADDFLAAQRLHRRRQVRTQSRILAIFMLLGPAVVWAGYFSPGMILLGAGGGGLIGEWVRRRILMPRRHLRSFHMQARWRETFTWRWDEEGIECTRESAHIRYGWRDCAGLEGDCQVLLLYRTANDFEILPRSWFGDSQQARELRELIERACRR